MKNVITCQPLPIDAKLPKIKPFHVTFNYHHSRFGDGLEMMNDGFREVLDIHHCIDEIMADNGGVFPISLANFYGNLLKRAETRAEKGLAIYRTALHNLNQWGSGETGHYLSRNFEFLNPESVDFY